MENLKITLIQSDLVWEDKEKNLARFSEKIDAVKEPTDLIVLPEMFTTGFSMAAEKLGEKMSGPTIQWLKEKANQKECVVTGTFICEEEGKYYNRLVWMRPDGTFRIYNKRHLFSMGDENNYYSCGNEKIIEEIKGWRLLPLVCYDLRFPVWSRNKLVKTNEDVSPEYDVLIYTANWPERRSYPWKTLLLARAIENQSYVVGVNRIGDDGNFIFHSGDSAVINFKGEIISTVQPGEETTITVELSYSEMQAFRKLLPALYDSDHFEIS